MSLRYGLRIIPFIQMYEFEALLFSDTKAFAEGIDNPELESALQQIADAFDTPEHINDSPQTAPSKRIVKLMYDYEKPLMGGLAALEIGLDTIRRECRLFDDWLLRLEIIQDKRLDD
jgi:hypothetical protein